LESHKVWGGGPPPQEAKHVGLMGSFPPRKKKRRKREGIIEIAGGWRWKKDAFNTYLADFEILGEDMGRGKRNSSRNPPPKRKRSSTLGGASS